MAQIKNQNPLKLSSLKHHAISFTEITPEMYLPRLKEAIEESKKTIAQIRETLDAPTFENTILALEMAGEEVDLASGVFYNQLHANTSDTLQALAGEIGPLLSNYSSDLLLDEKLFLRIQKIYEQKESLGKTKKLHPHVTAPHTYSTEELELLEKYYSNFKRNGALLNLDQKEKLRKIDSELAQLGPQYSENVLKATNQFQMLLTDEKEVDGLPPSSLESARIAAKEKGHSAGWLITLQAPSYIPFMQFAKHRASREKLYRAFSSRAFQGEFSNQTVILKILKLRGERAQLLGYKTHADYVLEKRMAEKPETVFAFIDQIKTACFNAALEDVKKVKAFAKMTEPIMPWDFSYWSERLKENLFQLNSEELRPYFSLDKVVAGAFEHARKLYGLTFVESKEYPKYHPDVTVYEVYTEDTKKFMGLFYTDFFPRENKNGGAWMTNYFEQGYFEGQVHRPHVSIVCSFTKPTSDKPSLLTFDEVNTLFHEFGHSLHSLLSQCKYRSLSGTNVYWDFVELPSQIMENWILEKESLDLFAIHYVTGETIPKELTQKIKDSSKFMAGYNSLRQITFSLLDMLWHTADFVRISDVSEFEAKILDPLRVLPKVDGTNISCSFSHIFAGGYSAGYYSYKWAEVLEADAFEMFLERGIFDRTTADSFKDNILSRGGTEHPMNLYKKFRGREPDPQALLRREGLI